MPQVKPSAPPSLLRLAAVRLAFFVFALAIVARLFQLQVVNANWYQLLATGQHELYAKLLPERGEIYIQDPLSSSKLHPVAVNRVLNLVYAVPKEIADPSAVASSLAPVLGVEPEVLLPQLAKLGDPYEPLQHGVSDEIAAQVADLNLSGIYTAPETSRFYPEGKPLAQVVGFVGFVGDYRQGQYGIEQAWEEVLRGQQGTLRSERDASGAVITLGEKQLSPAQDGANLVLTIDKNIQYRACSAIERAVVKHGAVGGSIIVLEPQTGAVRALCGAPSFDPNDYTAVTDLRLFSNPAVSAPYEPGSVFKPITMAAALEQGKVTPETTYVDTGEVRIGPNVIRNSDKKAHGLQTMTQVLEESLNTGAIFAMRQIGAKAFVDLIKQFGFGTETKIELPHEQPGNLRSLNDKREIYAATASFGQGITVTPMQLAAAFGAVANGGRLMQPRIVAEVRQPDGRSEVTKPVFVREVISSRSAATLGAMLVQVVEQGHGKRAGVPGYYVAGKTGTAEVPSPTGGYKAGKNIGTFAGFAPVSNPRFVMVVKIDEPTDVVFAESSAAPVFGEMAKFLLEYYQVPPERAVK